MRIFRACGPAFATIIGLSAVACTGNGQGPARATTPVARHLAPDFAGSILAGQNRFRAEVGVPPLVWDGALAMEAARYAEQLPALGSLIHSPRATRPNQGETLWYGTARAFRSADVVGSWASGRKYFKAGVFPDVSTSGSLDDVIHYTQMIWPTTTHVGCAFHSARGWDYVVCRYNPRGNLDGRRVP